MPLASTIVTLFLVLDPFGNAALFDSILNRLPPERRQAVLIRELLIAFALLLGFLFAGETILHFLAIRPGTLSISGGIMLFLIALGMVFPSRSILHEENEDEPFIVPLAVPMMAGPSTIALLLLLSSKYPDERLMTAFSVTVAWAASALVLLTAPWLLRFFGQRGSKAIERLMGLILTLISIQMLLDGLTTAGFLPPH